MIRRRNQKQLGDQAEDILSVYTQGAENQRIASVRKIPTPTKNAGGKIVYAEKSTVDYIGVMLDGSGRHVAVEAKRCSGTSFPLKMLKPHQRSYLRMVHRAGGVAALALVSPEFSGTEVFLVPWDEVERWIERERKGESMSANRDLWQPFRVSALSFLASWLRLPHDQPSPSPGAPSARPRP